MVVVDIDVVIAAVDGFVDFGVDDIAVVVEVGVDEIVVDVDIEVETGIYVVAVAVVVNSHSLFSDETVAHKLDETRDDLE